MRGFSTGRCIGQEELELWTLPGWFPALGKPGFPQIPQLRRLGVINGIPETDRLQISTPERGPGPEAGITAGYAPVWGRRNRKPPTDSAEEAKRFCQSLADVYCPDATQVILLSVITGVISNVSVTFIRYPSVPELAQELLKNCERTVANLLGLTAPGD